MQPVVRLWQPVQSVHWPSPIDSRDRLDPAVKDKEGKENGRTDEWMDRCIPTEAVSVHTVSVHVSLV